ncbi:MAG: DPP IV N-terminal domain-containing protein [Bacteroidaceae bacterium]
MKQFIMAAFILLDVAPAIAQGGVDDYKRAFALPHRFSAAKVVDAVSDVKWTDARTFSCHVQREDGRKPYTGTIDEKGSLTFSLSSDQGVRPPHKRDTPQPWSSPTLQGPQLVRNHWMNTDDERNARCAYSPDSSWVAYIANDNVHVSRPDGSQVRQLSFDGTLSSYYSAYIQWNAAGTHLAVCKIRPVAQKRYVYYVESSPRHQLQPILHQQEYAKPGDERMQRTPCVFEVATGHRVCADESAISNQYDLRNLEWNADGKAVTFEYNQRGHQRFDVLEMDAATGKMRTLVSETSSTFVNYSRYFRHTLADGERMLWMSERDGWNHLYMIDLKSGRVKQQLTKGQWVVRRVEHVDEENGYIYFSASGMQPDEDPYLVRYYRIDLDGRHLLCLTPETGNHQVQFSPDYAYIVDTWSTQEQPPVTVVRSTSRPEDVQLLAKADISRLKAEGWVSPEVFAAPGRDGKTLMWGIIQRPTNFDPSQSYPVVEYIYAGPGDAYVPKSFLPYNWNTSSLAELGFIVVQLDAMGTSYRGKAFEDVCYKNLRDAGFPDRMAWIKAAAARYPYMDVNRVGIYGCSAGGQESTAAVLFHGDFYKAAYSACGCHDNRMDKIWWNEQWMGWPVDSSYVASSNVENAHLLERPLMLMVGEMDDNVDPASTMQLADALIRAGKDFELVVVPGAHHSMGESFGEHKRYDFFVRHLLHKEPPRWNLLRTSD